MKYKTSYIVLRSCGRAIIASCQPRSRRCKRRIQSKREWYGTEIILTTREAAWYVISVASARMYVCLSYDNFRMPWRRKFIFANPLYLERYRPSSFVPPHSARTHLRRSPCVPPEVQPDLRLCLRSTVYVLRCILDTHEWNTHTVVNQRLNEQLLFYCRFFILKCT